MLDSIDNHKLLSDRGQALLADIDRPKTHGETVAYINEVAALPPAERTEFWIQAATLLDAGDYQTLHGFYIRYCLGHAWGREMHMQRWS